MGSKSTEPDFAKRLQGSNVCEKYLMINAFTMALHSCITETLDFLKYRYDMLTV